MSLQKRYHLELEEGSEEDETKFTITKKKKSKKKKKTKSEKKENGWPYDCEGDENDAKYCEIVDGSEGFDSFSDPTSTMSGSIRPWSVRDKSVKLASKFAVEEQNKTTGSNLILNKVVKVNAQIQCGIMLYMTLKILDGDGDQAQPVFYEAKVLHHIEDVFHVEIFRKAIHYKDKGGGSMEENSVKKGSDSSTSTWSGSFRSCPPDGEVATLVAKFAVEEHNKRTGANMILKEIAYACLVKVNVPLRRGLSFCMELEMLGGDGDQTQPVLYEVHVIQDIDGVYELKFFRKAIDDEGERDLKSDPGGSADAFTNGSVQRYLESGSENISLQKCAFFDVYNDEEWLKKKYHPTNLLGVIRRRNERAQRNANGFLFYIFEIMRLYGGDPGVAAFSPIKSGQTSEPNSDDAAADAGRKRKHDKGQDEESDFSAGLKAQLVSSEHGLTEIDIEGFPTLVPILVFEEEFTNFLKLAFQDLIEQGRGEESDFSAALKAHPVSSKHTRIQSHMKRALALVGKLDIEKGIKDNLIYDAATKFFLAGRDLYGNQPLNMLLAYLWCVHGVDYYGMTESHEPSDVWSDSKSHGQTSEWEKKLDLFWEKRLRSQDPLEAMTGKEKIDAADVEALDQYVRKIDDEKNGWKYGCEAKGCTELFHSTECAHEHLKLKHPELVMKLTSKVREDLYFHNYMSDPDACDGTPDKPSISSLMRSGRL